MRYSGRSFQRRAAIRSVVVGSALGLLCAAVGAAPASADTGALTYSCSVSILTNQPLTVVVRGTAPRTTRVGSAVTLGGFSATVSINAAATSSLYLFLGARSVTGTVALPIAAEGTSLPPATAQLAMPATPVPAFGALTAPLVGASPAFTPTAPGTIRFRAQPFTAQLVTTDFTGSTMNVPADCQLNPGQDATIATTTVVAAA